jgi:uncharacterized protein involved in exopolysaccharide biosynthesis
MNEIRQEDFAEALGISRSTLINYEKGYTKINVEVLERLQTVYPEFTLEDQKSGPEKKPIIHDNVIDFAVLGKVIWSGRQTIGKFLLITTLLGILGSLLLTNYYQATITMFPARDETRQLGQFQALAANLGFSMLEKRKNFNIPEVVKSRRLAELILTHPWRIYPESPPENLLSFWKLEEPSWYLFWQSPEPKDSLTLLDEGLRILKTRLKVLENRRTGLIQVNVEMQSPTLAAAVANFIGDEVQRYIQQENSAQASKERQFTETRLAVVKNELTNLENQLKSFQERNRVINKSPELQMEHTRLLREVEAKQQVYITLQQQLELARIEEVKQTSIIHILDRAVPPSRKSRPNRALIVVLSALFGLVVGTSVVVVKR